MKYCVLGGLILSVSPQSVYT